MDNVTHPSLTPARLVTCELEIMQPSLQDHLGALD